jgi:hypothetical protein
MLTVQHQQEALSRAYIQAVAARCGVSSSIPTPDYGIDLTLHGIAVVGQRRIESGHKLDLQAKCTTLAHLSADHVHYDVPVRDYDCLRLDIAGTPRILVVLVLPGEDADWFSQTEEQLVLRRCAYWISLKGSPATTNRKSLRLQIPRANAFSVTALQSILDRIRQGGEP